MITRSATRIAVVGGVLTCALFVRPVAAVAESDLSKVVVHRSAETGAAKLMTTVDGSAIPVTTQVRGGQVRGGQVRGGQARGGQVTALDFLREHGGVFGVSDAMAQLQAPRVHVDALGYTHSSFDQVHKSVRVFSGVLRVHQTAGGDVRAANGAFYVIPDKISAVPAITEEQAIGLAEAQLDGANPRVHSSELVFVDPGWYGDSPIGPHLAYHIELVDAAQLIHEAFFVDARDGKMLDRWSRVCTIRDRQIHDGERGFLLPGELVRSEGDPPVSFPIDVNRAYDYYGDTYDYYFRAFGRDSIDGLGMLMVATVNSTAPPCPNAFWSPSLLQMVFCNGTVTDDIVGHELAHGVTEFSANLIYQNQSGQLNEAFSDIFGELVDLFNGDASVAGEPGGIPWPEHPTGPGDDTPNQLRTGCSPPFLRYPDGVRWMIGEDAQAFGGAIRDMWNPPCFGDPDYANSALQRCWPFDSGGVHSGSGVFNHAFAIATDGKAFNGITVNGIGAIKTGAVFYRALTTYLTPASDFEDTYYLINQAAQDLIGTFPNDPRTGSPSDEEFTASDADEIDKALRAVELNTVGRCGVRHLLITDDPPVCDGRTTIYADDFENGLNEWRVEAPFTGSPEEGWSQVDALPDGRPGKAWFVPNRGGSCFDPEPFGRQELISPPVTLPATVRFPTMKFTHQVQTEAFYDGGNLKINVDGGGWQLIPGIAFAFNAYNLSELELGFGGPLEGEPAFSGHGGQWGTSLVDLRGFVTGGETVEFRFDFGEDVCSAVAGWYVDDFEVYDCASGEDCNENGIADEAELALGPHPDVILDQPPAYGALVRLGFEFFDTPRGLIDDALTYAQPIHLGREKTITSVRIWGGYWGGGAGGDEFLVFVRDMGGDGFPARLAARVAGTTQGRWTRSGVTHSGIEIWDIELVLDFPITRGPGDYFVEVYRSNSARGDFFWEISEYGPHSFDFVEDYYVRASETPGSDWSLPTDYWGFPVSVSLSMQLIAGTRGADCNENGTPDDCEVADGLVPDENGNGVPDSCDADCNNNGVPDDLDIARGNSDDCDGDLVPEECEADCNNNGSSDRCDLFDAAFGAGARDQCADAEPICLGGTYAGDTRGADSDGRASCGASFDSPDVWYRYSPAGDGFLVVSTCESTFDTVVSIHTGCPGSTFNQVDCSNDDCGVVRGGSSAFAAVESGKTYYVRVSGFNGASGAFNLLVEFAAPCLDAALVDCDDDGVLNACESPGGSFDDCNTNAIPDDCDVNLGIAADCDQNIVPDECQVDGDGDGVIDVCDGCPSDPDKPAPGVCGCGAADTDSDGDGLANCVDGCPNDRRKTAPGLCGCGVFESTADRDGDGTADCIDRCPDDANKAAPGFCGCGNAETDTDNDGVPDCRDVCAPGDDSIDADDDGTPDCADGCPNDADKIAPGVCGCGVSDVDPDLDEIMTCNDNCPMNANPDQIDTDTDGIGDMCDGCPADTAKTARGICGCGSADVDTDQDGLFDCADNCPDDPTTNHADSDGDGVGDACDECPADRNKTVPGVCGCGRGDIDVDGDGVLACNDDCIGTPAGVAVDDRGCPITQTPAPQPTPAPGEDLDGDGIADDVDVCGNTPVGAAVDADGCAVGDDVTSNGIVDGSGDEAPCGTMGMVSMLLLAAGLVGLRQRMR